ncbi:MULTISPECIES: MOSC domain-containing protein [unclassified Sinorhizobium]|uniref:MOSC domain-containing protein n=1 Tax=unclassified Sinorhizobium TaxID=2613772 RepID=UPI003525AEA8
MPSVISVSRRQTHEFSKTVVDTINIIENFGVEGDAHAGVTVKHRSRVAVDPTQPNLRQVHLLHAELFDELLASGFVVQPGDLGENIVTEGIALLDLPAKIGEQVVLRVTGLRNPCGQIDNFQQGLLKAVLGRDEDGNLVRKAGIMSVVLQGGTVRPGDRIEVVLPALPHERLERV